MIPATISSSISRRPLSITQPVPPPCTLPGFGVRVRPGGVAGGAGEEGCVNQGRAADGCRLQSFT